MSNPIGTLCREASASNESLTRERIVSLLAGAAGPLVFESCTFAGDDLARLVLDGCELRSCILVDCSLTGASLRESRWYRCRASRTTFAAADLVDSQFVACDLNNTRWTRAKVSAASFKECKLTGADFDHAGGLVPPTFEDTLLVGANLRQMTFRKRELRNLDFSDADLSGCDFTGATFIGGSLRNARLNLTRFAGCDLREVDLGGLKLANLHLLKGATISRHQAGDLLRELGVQVA